jgi:hypothetical protein
MRLLQNATGKPKATMITKLINSQGSAVTKNLELEETCRQYYSKLYDQPANSSNEAERLQVLNSIPVRFTESMNATLGHPITSQELLAAVRKMAKDRSLGPDGINIFFYTKFWDVIGQEFTEMINKAVANRSLPPGMTKGLISLIFKSGEPDDLGNYRPIILLNTSYKISTKTLQLRLQSMLSEIIDLDQTVFIPMRFILDNILVTHETIDHAQRSNQELVFLKLDYRKAFDRVD